MKPLCIVDTYSLIYLSEITVARRSLHKWLWDEFNVAYSAAVWDEIQYHLAKMGRDGRVMKRGGHQYVWPLSAVVTFERILFAQPFEREVETGFCKQCRRPKFDKKPFLPNLGKEEDKGERHNCCVALDAVMGGNHRQMVFLTDDHNAIRDYAGPVFETFPIGCTWTSYDFVLYLFVRHRKRITQEEVKNALWDIRANAIGPVAQSSKAEDQWNQRYWSYCRKIEKVYQVLNSYSGG